MLSLPRPGNKTALSVVLLLAAGLVLRLYLLSGPQTQLEADEAVVGLMARHILEGDRPVFYWGQNYMGALEAYLAAIPIGLLGSSTLALKIAPLVIGLVFVGLLFATGYRVGGLSTGLIAGLYAAVPPAFLALWSLKARGGYIEVMVLGQLLILVALDAAKRRSIGVGRGALIGVLAGVGLWTNTLIALYLLPIAIYLALTLRRRLLGWWIVPAAATCLIGLAPLISYNLANNFATLGAMFTPDEALRDPADAFERVLRFSLPVLAGLAQGSSGWDQFRSPYAAGIGATRPALVLLPALYLALILSQARTLIRVARGREEPSNGAVLLALILVVAPLAFIFSKFREQVTEPRYLLPIYSAGPVLAACLVSSLGRRLGIEASAGRSRHLLTPLARLVLPVCVAGFLALNLYSVASLDEQLNLPEPVVTSNPANRAELASFLTSHGLERIYTDYWLGYPLTYETGERVVCSTISGGYNRYVPYAYLVAAGDRPAFVFISGSNGEAALLEWWKGRGVTATKAEVSVYSVYYDALPLDLARP